MSCVYLLAQYSYKTRRYRKFSPHLFFSEQVLVCIAWFRNFQYALNTASYAHHIFQNITPREDSAYWKVRYWVLIFRLNSYLKQWKLRLALLFLNPVSSFRGLDKYWYATHSQILIFFLHLLHNFYLMELELIFFYFF